MVDQYKKSLVDFFGGLTDFRHKNEGLWKVGGVTFRDEMILLRVLGSSQDKAREFLKNLQKQIEVELKQEKILIIERQVNSLH